MRGLDKSGDPPNDGGMEARIAQLEATTTHIKEDVSELRKDVRELRADSKVDFRITWGGLIAVALGLAFLMAKGFKWL